VEQVILGAIAAVSATVALFFLRFWRQTRDRFFLLFSAAFFLEAVNRIAFALLPYANDDEPLFYLVRLLSYGLILLAIWRKNRGASR
jgi:predicted permease